VLLTPPLGAQIVEGANHLRVDRAALEAYAHDFPLDELLNLGQYVGAEQARGPTPVHSGGNGHLEFQAWEESAAEYQLTEAEAAAEEAEAAVLLAWNAVSFSTFAAPGDEAWWTELNDENPQHSAAAPCKFCVGEFSSSSAAHRRLRLRCVCAGGEPAGRGAQDCTQSLGVRAVLRHVLAPVPAAELGAFLAGLSEEQVRRELFPPAASAERRLGSRRGKLAVAEEEAEQHAARLKFAEEEHQSWSELLAFFQAKEDEAAAAAVPSRKDEMRLRIACEEAANASAVARSGLKILTRRSSRMVKRSEALARAQAAEVIAAHRWEQSIAPKEVGEARAAAAAKATTEFLAEQPSKVRLLAPALVICFCR